MDPEMLPSITLCNCAGGGRWLQQATGGAGLAIDGNKEASVGVRAVPLSETGPAAAAAVFALRHCVLGGAHSIEPRLPDITSQSASLPACPPAGITKHHSACAPPSKPKNLTHSGVDGGKGGSESVSVPLRLHKQEGRGARIIGIKGGKPPRRSGKCAPAWAKRVRHQHFSGVSGQVMMLSNRAWAQLGGWQSRQYLGGAGLTAVDGGDSHSIIASSQLGLGLPTHACVSRLGNSL